MKRTRFYLLIGFFSAAALFLLWYFDILMIPSAGPAPSWAGITPGQTRQDDAMRMLGKPEMLTMRLEYQILVFGHHEGEQEFSGIELWSKQQGNVFTVKAIYEAGTPSGMPTVPDLPSLNILVAEFGRPDQVSYSAHCNQRFLIWAHNGIAVRAEAANGNDWSKYQVYSALYFVPTGIRTFNNASLPWPDYKDAFYPGSACKTTDTLPQDPYLWK